MRDLISREFPWGNTQALSFALFRTYAVPSIGDLLCDTRQFTEHPEALRRHGAAARRTH